MTGTIGGPGGIGSSKPIPKVTPTRKGRNNPDKRKFNEDIQDTIVEDVEFSARAARTRAEALEEELAHGRAAFGRRQLETMDELLTTYHLLIGLLMARGDIAGVQEVAEHAARITGRAPEAAANAMRNAEHAAGDDAYVRAKTLAEIKTLTRSVAGKMQAIAAETSRAARQAATMGARDEMEGAAQTLLETAAETLEAAGLPADAATAHGTPDGGAAPPTFINTEA